MYKRNAIQQLSALVWILVRKSFVRMYAMAQEGTRDYLAIPKGRGFVYAHANQLYNRVKTCSSVLGGMYTSVLLQNAFRSMARLCWMVSNNYSEAAKNENFA